MFDRLGTFWFVVTRSLRRTPGIDARLWIDHGGAAARSLVTAHVRCDAVTAFDYVSDFSRHSEWTTGQVRITPLTPGLVALGTRLRAEGFQGGRWWPADLEVTGFERPSRFEFTATGGPIASPEGRPHRHTYTFVPEDDGMRLSHARIDPVDDRLLWHLLGPVVIRATGGVRVTTIANLRARLEVLGATRA